MATVPSTLVPLSNSRPISHKLSSAGDNIRGHWVTDVVNLLLLFSISQSLNMGVSLKGYLNSVGASAGVNSGEAQPLSQ